MPPLAALAIGVAASELGVAGAVTSAIVGAGILDGTAAIIAGAAITGAAVGATSAAITGGDPGQGALFGALSGGLTTGLAPEVQSATDFSQGVSNAITTAGVTTGLRVAQGQALGKAAEAGAVSGAGSYAGGQLQGFINQQTSPSGATSPPLTSQSPQAPGGSYTPDVETVVSSANAPSADIGGAGLAAAPGVETVHVTGQRQSPSQSDLNLATVLNLGARVAGKTAIGAVVQGLDALIGGGSYYSPSGASAGTAGSTGAAPTASPGSAPGAATAAGAQSGQAGSSSVYAPGSPIFGDDGSATKRGVWNTASLRTPDAEGA